MPFFSEIAVIGYEFSQISNDLGLKKINQERLYLHQPNDNVSKIKSKIKTLTK